MNNKILLSPNFVCFYSKLRAFQYILGHMYLKAQSYKFITFFWLVG